MNINGYRQLVRDLFTPNPWIYWADFLGSIALAWICFLAVEVLPDFSWLQIAAFLVSTFAFYRATLFIHEVSHLAPGAVPFFAPIWNLLCGIPMMFPSFLYKGVHIEHHKRHTYGTSEDGEYLPFGADAPWKIVSYLAQSFIVALPLIARFGIIGPLSFLHVGFRRFVMERFSALAIDFVPKRKIPRGRELFDWYWQEILTSMWVIFVAVMFYRGIFPIHALVHWYFMFVLLFLVNSLRTLAAHRYRNKSGELNFEEQLLDSVNVEGQFFITELWGAVGLRYHGLHHYFPNMPYHNLGIAHRRFVNQLPKDDPYRRTIETSLFSALRTLWRDASNAEEAQSSSHPAQV